MRLHCDRTTSAATHPRCLAASPLLRRLRIRIRLCIDAPPLALLAHAHMVKKAPGGGLGGGRSTLRGRIQAYKRQFRRYMSAKKASANPATTPEACRSRCQVCTAVDKGKTSNKSHCTWIDPSTGDEQPCPGNSKPRWGRYRSVSSIIQPLHACIPSLLLPLFSAWAPLTTYPFTCPSPEPWYSPGNSLEGSLGCRVQILWVVLLLLLLLLLLPLLHHLLLLPLVVLQVFLLLKQLLLLLGPQMGMWLPRSRSSPATRLAELWGRMERLEGLPGLVCTRVALTHSLTPHTSPHSLWVSTLLLSFQRLSIFISCSVSLKATVSLNPKP